MANPRPDVATCRTESTADNLRMYLKEMGSVPLLTRQREIALARKMELGMRRVLVPALAGVLRPHDLVYGTLGRDSHPAVGLLPPGILGHDPGKRRSYLSTDQAREMLETAGHTGKIVLRASIHPSFRERFGSLFQGMLAVWKELGVRVEVRKGNDMASFLDSWVNSDGR